MAIGQRFRSELSDLVEQISGGSADSVQHKMILRASDLIAENTPLA
jgi:hypothetical protein